MGLSIQELQKKVKQVKRQALEMCLNVKMGHLTSGYSCAEIVTVLYYCIMNIDCKNPNWEKRDRFIMSKNHGSLIVYPILADLGFFEQDRLMTFDCDGSNLGGHSKLEIPGVDFAGGALGIGLGVAAGLAYGARLKGEDYYTYVILGDGECYEGSVWEGAMFAGHHRLEHLVAIVDKNHMSASDDTKVLLSQEPLADKWRSFGWNVIEVDGHDIKELRDVFSSVKQNKVQKPTCIIADTVKGKGIEFLRCKGFHGTLPFGEGQITNAYASLEEEY